MTGAEIGILAAAIGVSTILARIVEKLVSHRLGKGEPAAQDFNGTPRRLERAVEHLEMVADKLAIVADRMDRRTQ